MDQSEAKSGGLIESLKRVGDTAIALLQNRLELLAVELQEEKHRAVQLLLWLSLGLGFVVAGVGVGVATLALFCWQQWHYAGLVGLTLVVLAVGVLILWWMGKRLKSGPLPFSGTVGELKKDREWLRRKH